MLVLMPLSVVFLALAAVLALSYYNLSSSRRAVDEMWQHLDAARQRGIDIMPVFLRSIAADCEVVQRTSMCSGRVYAAIKSLQAALLSAADATAASHHATTPCAAAQADTELMRAVERVYTATELLPGFNASLISMRAGAQLEEAECDVAQVQRAYNNHLVMLSNAMNTFPATLFAKRRGITVPERYDSVVATWYAPYMTAWQAREILPGDSPETVTALELWATSSSYMWLDDLSADPREGTCSVEPMRRYTKGSGNGHAAAAVEGQPSEGTSLEKNLQGAR